MKERANCRGKQRPKEKNKRPYSVVVAVIWSLCSAAWIVALCLDFIHHNSVVSIVLHAICAVLAGICAVLNFAGWRRMKAISETEDLSAAKELRTRAEEGIE